MASPATRPRSSVASPRPDALLTPAGNSTNSGPTTAARSASRRCGTSRSCSGSKPKSPTRPPKSDDDFASASHDEWRRRCTSGCWHSDSWCPDGSATAKAIDYSLKRWPALTHYIGDGDVPISNNWVENQIRPIALGRANWLFAGSLRAGQRAAAVMSLVHSAKINGHDPYAY